MRKFLTGTLVAASLTQGAILYAGNAGQKYSFDFAKATAFGTEWSGGDEGKWVFRGGGATRAMPCELDRTLCYKDAKLPEKFTVSATVRIDSPSGAHFAGVVFNFQDPKNFYVFRVNSGTGENGLYQVLKMVDGAWKGVKGAKFDAIKSGVPYTLIVQGKAPGSFTFSIKNGETDVLKAGDATDPNGAPYVGGLAGLYTGASDCTILNFTLEAASVPTGTAAAAPSQSAQPKEKTAAVDAPKPGSLIPRTMKALATSSKEHHNPVNILFYGQSITAQPWSYAVHEELKKRFPDADITFKNLAIGGYEAPSLIRTAEADLYPTYPDLLFLHVYGGHKTGELEKLIANIRSRTTAEIILATHHYRASNNPEAVIKDYDADGSDKMRELAAKYGCELVEVRDAWKKEMDDNNLKPEAFLADGIHLNPKGNELMAKLVLPHFQYVEGSTNKWSDCVKTVPAKKSADGSYTLVFEGNRVDAIASALKAGAKPGTAKVLFDGKAPSEIPELCSFNRVSNAPAVWWPAIKCVSNEKPLLLEDWSAKITKINDTATEFEFVVTGSKTGEDGVGNNKAKFVSKSGRVVIEPSDWAITFACQYSKKPIPVGTEFKWTVVPLASDAYAQPEVKDLAKVYLTPLARCLPNGKHTLKLIPQGDVEIAEFRIHTPPGAPR